MCSSDLWLRREKGGAHVLVVRHAEDSRRWTVRSPRPRKKGEPTSAEPADAPILGDLVGGILSLESPLHESVRLHLCRFEDEDVLLPENAVRFESGRAPLGVVYAAGEEWTARSADESPIDRGTPVRIVRQDGLTLVVERADAPSPAI